MTIQHYVLDEAGEPKPATSEEVFAWRAADPQANIVAQEVGEDLVVSTIFACYDMNQGMGSPEFFETSVFRRSGWDSGFLGGAVETVRYATRQEAERGHVLMKLKWYWWYDDEEDDHD